MTEWQVVDSPNLEVVGAVVVGRSLIEVVVRRVIEGCAGRGTLSLMARAAPLAPIFIYPESFRSVGQPTGGGPLHDTFPVIAIP